MRILIAITMILGACFILLIALLSVVHDLLVRTTHHVPSEFDVHAIDREGASNCSNVEDSSIDERFTNSAEWTEGVSGVPREIAPDIWGSHR